MIPHDDVKMRRQVIRHLLDYCLAEAHRLSEWEDGFVHSLEDQFEGGSNLTDRQAAKLEEIHDRL